MQVINSSRFYKNMKEIMAACCENHELAIITRQNKPSVVMMSLEDYNAWQENIGLMQNLPNHVRASCRYHYD